MVEVWKDGDILAEQLLKTIFQVRRGMSSEWESVNPILRAGEPSFAIDTAVFKIGNGVDRWKDLKVQGGGTVVIARPTFNDFPTTGDEENLYISTSDNQLYRWDDNVKEYFKLSGGGITSSDAPNKIKVLSDGTAEVNSVTVDKLETGDSTFVLDGGNSTNVNKM